MPGPEVLPTSLLPRGLSTRMKTPTSETRCTEGHTRRDEGIKELQGNETNKTQEGRPHDSEIIFQYLRELGKKLESLEKKVNDMAHRNVESDRNGEKVRESVSENEKECDGKKKNEGKECKFLVRGKEKTLKSHTLMHKGVTGLDTLLRSCVNEEKKEKLFRDWLKMHELMEKVSKSIDDISSEIIDTGAQHGSKS